MSISSILSNWFHKDVVEAVQGEFDALEKRLESRLLVVEERLGITRTDTPPTSGAAS